MPMLSKLALRNAKRSAKDYGIYLLTVTLIFSLLYAFNMIMYSEDIQMLNKMMASMKYTIIIASVFIVFICAWMVHYMNRFMLQRRSREFGIYMTLGISNRAISKLFLRENILMGTISFLFSLVTGTFLYQFLTLIIMNIFEANYRVKITFSHEALLLTLLYLVLIYGFSILRSKRRLRKMKIHDLLYADKQNETMKFKSTKGSVLLFILSILAAIIGGGLLWYVFSNGDNNVTPLRLGIVFLLCVFSTYGFYISLSSILIKAFIENKKLKYQKGLFLLIRSLSSKMNTMRITLGTLGIILALTMTAFSVGVLFKGYFDTQVDAVMPFDIALGSVVEGRDFQEYQEYLKENFEIRDEWRYTIYRSGSRGLYDLLEETPMGGSYYEDDTVMAYSDYKRLREMLGYQEVDLQEGHFIVQGSEKVEEVIKKVNNFNLTFRNERFLYQETRTEDFALHGINGAYYIIILPDEMVQSMEVRGEVLAIDTVEETTMQDYEELNSLNAVMHKRQEPDGNYTLFADDITVKGALLSENRTTFTIITFSLFYLGLVFVCVAATILSVQQLSDAVQYKFRFKILHNLGMERQRMDFFILKQLFFYFGFPILLPIVFSSFITACFNQMFEAFFSGILLTSLATSLGLFLVIYCLYFVATWIGFRKSVLEEAR